MGTLYPGHYYSNGTVTRVHGVQHVRLKIVMINNIIIDTFIFPTILKIPGIVYFKVSSGSFINTMLQNCDTF